MAYTYDGLIPNFSCWCSHSTNAKRNTNNGVMYMWNGSSKCDFSQFQIEYVPSKIKYSQKTFNLNVDKFKSGKGISLGMTSSKLKTKFGNPSETRHEDGLVIFSYQQYNDLYSADYYFKNDKLMKFRYGNECP